MKITKLKSEYNKYNVTFQISRGKASALAYALRKTGTPLGLEILEELERAWGGLSLEDREDLPTLAD